MTVPLAPTPREAPTDPFAGALARLLADTLTLYLETLIATTHAVLRAAEAAGDAATIGLASRRLAVHEKTRWMLRVTGEAGA